MSDESSKLVRLDFWSEIIGPYIGSYRIDQLVYFKIGGKAIAFDSDTKEADILRSKLKDEFIGHTVGILRTNSIETPLVVRIMMRDRTTK